jgi:hypothetical protein
MIAVRYRDFPVTYIDTPGEIERRKQAIKKFEDSLPEDFRIEINGRIYRLRCFNKTPEGAVCEFLYSGEWRRVRNLGIIEIVKGRYKHKRGEARHETVAKAED